MIVVIHQKSGDVNVTPFHTHTHTHTQINKNKKEEEVKNP